MRGIRFITIDWSRNEGAASKMSVAVWRFGQLTLGNKVLHLPYLVLNFFLLRLLIGIDLPARLQCGPGLRLHHGGRGVSLNRRAIIGRNAEIFPLVSIGNRNDSGCPVIGDDVIVGTGARVLGPIEVGHGAKVGPNAVVVRDVPAGRTVVAPEAVLLQR